MKRAHLHRSIALILVLTLFLLALPAAAAEEITVRNNLYREGVGIRVSMSDTVNDPENAFSVIGPDGALTITSVTAEGKIYTIVTEEEIDYTIDAVTEVVAYLRSISPVWRDLESGKQNFVIQ